MGGDVGSSGGGGISGRTHAAAGGASTPSLGIIWRPYLVRWMIVRHTCRPNDTNVRSGHWVRHGCEHARPSRTAARLQFKQNTAHWRPPAKSGADQMPSGAGQQRRTISYPALSG